MFLRIVGASLLALLIPFTATAQEAKTVEQLDKEIQNLKTQITTTLANVSKLTEAVTKNTEATIANKSSIDSLLDKQTEMLQQLDELTSLQQEQFVRQQQMMESVVQQDSSGVDVLRLSANMQRSEEFRQEVRKAVHDSLREEGDVIIRNKMASSQRIKVNQTDYDIPAGETLTLKVPVGTLTAQLAGQPLTNWTISPPKYSQKIDIVPEQPTTVTALRPIEAATPVTTYRPYTSDPIYVSPVETYYVDPTPVYWYNWGF